MSYNASPMHVTQKEVENWMRLDLPSLSAITPFAALRADFQHKVNEVLRGNSRILSQSRMEKAAVKERVFAYQAAFLTLVHRVLLKHLSLNKTTCGFDTENSNAFDQFAIAGIVVPYTSIEEAQTRILQFQVKKLLEDHEPPFRMNDWTNENRILDGLRSDYAFNIPQNADRSISNADMIGRGVKHAFERIRQMYSYADYFLRESDIENYDSHKQTIRRAARVITDFTRSTMGALSTTAQFMDESTFGLSEKDGQHFLHISQSDVDFAGLFGQEEENGRVIGCPSEFALAQGPNGIQQSLTTTICNWSAAAVDRWQLKLKYQI